MKIRVVDNLLPPGFEDFLPPFAAREAHTVSALCRCFAGFGFEYVKPPLLEYVRTLDSETGSRLAGQLFTMQDPQSAQTMALRADITVQVARIAATCLSEGEPPLRLFYAGQVARRCADEQRRARQYTQAGIEIIGVAPEQRINADIEILRVIITALNSLGINELLIDITLPSFVRDLILELRFNEQEKKELLKAFDRRDRARVSSFGYAILDELLDIKGDALTILVDLARLVEKNGHSLLLVQIEEAQQLIERLQDIHTLRINLDVCEQRGTSYHQGIGFNIFATGHLCQLGAGGRYQSKGNRASGATFYLDGLLPLIEESPSSEKRLLVPLTTGEEMIKSYQEQGWVTLLGADTLEQEIQVRCATHVLCEQTGKIRKVV